MAFFDPSEQRMCVRVVYDGVAGSGKTTNLRQLCALFASQRTTELYTPAELDGRTLYFDWAQIHAGVVCGFPLMCQVISVPGHVVLTPRRRHLLATADVVVYVCDSAASSFDRAHAGLALLDRIGEERGAPVPFLLQANKQDQPTALAGEAILRRLGREGTDLVEAIATDGIGVVDTFVHAVRAVSRSMQERTRSAPFHVHVRPAERAADVLAALAHEPLDPELAAEMLLEEASAAFLLEASGLTSLDVTRGNEGAPPPPRTLGPDPAHATDAAATRDDRDDLGSHSGPRPRLPQADVPTGFVWPAHTGRGTLRQLHRLRSPDGCALEDVVARVDERGAFVHEVGGYSLRTSTEARYDDAEAARQALVRAARERTQLGPLLAPETLLVAQADAGGACWIWTVSPKMPDVVAWLDAHRGDAGDTAPVLEAFGRALATALAVSRGHGLGMDYSAQAYGLHQGTVCYLGDLATNAHPGERVPDAIVAAIRFIEDLGDDVSLVVDGFARELRRRLDHEVVVDVLLHLGLREAGEAA